MTVTFAYASKSDQNANAKVLQRVGHLKVYVRNHICHADVDFEFWDCRKLLQPRAACPLQLKRSRS